MTETLEDILADDYLGDVAALPMEQVRARRATCKEIETGLSFLRRLVQGRLDVVAAERARRTEGGDGDDLEDLIARLPQLLAGSTRSEGMGRLPSSLGTGVVDHELQYELDGVISDSRLGEPGSLTDTELETASHALVQFEQKVSGLRRTLFDRIDALEEELTRRYKSGEASVDSLLT
ncbi:RsiG family protein [Actinospongicola halichondriae]|uniref:RsiG family protein n=1 Tax=Actinospongicola halichondriae TaxID=3236844 RepID=UPI003D45E716